MKYEIKKIENDVLRVTTTDERWYGKPDPAHDGEYIYYPSVTWIAQSYPKGIGYFKWLAQKGWDEAEALKIAAGDKGSKVHKACEDIDAGKEVKFYSKYTNPSTGLDEELTVQEWECLMAFHRWLDEVKPKLIKSETTVFNEKEQYAGTLDRLYLINGELWIVDLKTSQYIWASHEIQISAYAHAEMKIDSMVTSVGPFKLAILQLGYFRNKKGFKFTPVADKYDLFLNAKAIWHNDHGTEKPKQKDYPISLQAECRKGEKK